MSTNQNGLSAENTPPAAQVRDATPASMGVEAATVNAGSIVVDNGASTTIAVAAPAPANADHVAIPPSSSATTPPGKERNYTPRGADPALDNVPHRHHALCTAAVVCDLKLGGYDAARAVAEPLKSGIKASEVAKDVVAVSPWLLNADHLNFNGASGYQKLGIQRFFHLWMSNRVYYFYYDPERGEHPIRRRKANLRAVYREFYDTFAADIAARVLITEECAMEFWHSVADRVPFREPSSGVMVNASEAVNSTNGDTGAANGAFANHDS